MAKRMRVGPPAPPIDVAGAAGIFRSMFEGLGDIGGDWLATALGREAALFLKSHGADLSSVAGQAAIMGGGMIARSAIVAAMERLNAPPGIVDDVADRIVDLTAGFHGGMTVQQFQGQLVQNVQRLAVSEQGAVKPSFHDARAALSGESRRLLVEAIRAMTDEKLLARWRRLEHDPRLTRKADLEDALVHAATGKGKKRTVDPVELVKYLEALFPPLPEPAKVAGAAAVEKVVSLAEKGRVVLAEEGQKLWTALTTRRPEDEIDDERATVRAKRAARRAALKD